MSAFVPLFQTALWVSLIVWLILRFKKEVAGILLVVQERLKKGSSLSVGFIELGQDDIRSQGIQEQKKRMEKEIQEVEEAAGPALTAPETVPRPSTDRIRSRYLLAEDLMIRELQSEFGALVNRSVKFTGFELDGFFVKDSCAFGIEVKYVQHSIPVDAILKTLDRIQQAIHRFGWRRFTLLLALVCDHDDAASASELENIQAHASQIGLTVITRVYTLQALSAKFGIEPNNTDNSQS